jgi:endoglucanase
MPKHFFFFALAFFFSGCHTTATTLSNPSTSRDEASVVKKNGNLSVRGTRIVNERGQDVQLAGMSFFWSQWMGKYYTPETVSWLKNDWKCTVVRAAMGIEHGGYLQNPEIEKQKVFSVVDAAIEHGLYVIIDWHDHHAEDHAAEAVTFFTEVAKKYGHHPNIIYEVYNEPLNVSWSDVIKPYSEKVIEAIRKHDPDNIIACGSRQWSQRVDEAALDPIRQKNIVYTLHYYASTHKQELRDIAKKAIDLGIPLFVTEFGVTEASGDGKIDSEESRKWWAFLDEHKISWCNWSVADKKENASALKPGTATHGWDSAMLNESGKMVKTEISKRGDY